jgi:alkanesulfonate monooxygenase SsuD/methylene tetrahydromethanopterin reductase-like flavin-dependent oxidoreductase (luciferase family)
MTILELCCTPKPVQRPIPVWLGATQGEAIRRAARQGQGLLGGGPTARRQYLAALADYGKTDRDAHIASGGRFLFCSQDPKRDWDLLKPHALYQLQNYARWFKAAGQPVFGDPPANYAELEARGVYLCGTPEQIIQAIRDAHEQAPFERHFFWAIWPGVDPANEQHRTLRPRSHPEPPRPVTTSRWLTRASIPLQRQAMRDARRCVAGRLTAQRALAKNAWRSATTRSER